MKKLFKHLAIVLALALVIGLVPARTAEAADYSLKFKNKYLYVGAKGETAKGVDSLGNLPVKPIKRSLKFGKGVIEGLKKGDVVTFKSADRSIARGSKKYQRVFAVGTAGNGEAGETDVVVKVNGEEIGSMHFIVKQNAKSLAIDAASEIGIGDVEIKVNVEPASATDIISLVIPEEYKDIAVVKEGTTITTKKPGTFKIQAVAQQNDSTLTGYHVKSEEVELQAAVKVISAKQKSKDQIILEFDSDVSSFVNAKDFTVYYKPMTGANVTTAVKAADPVEDEPTKVVLTLWNDFIEGTEYFVDYSGQTNSFVSAKLGPQYAAKIVVNNLEITAGKLTPYDYKVLDANDVELPLDKMEDYVKFAGDSTANYTIFEKEILFDEAGLQANVTATFDAYYEDADGNTKQNTFKNAFLFKSVAAVQVQVTNVYWQISSKDGKTTFSASDFDKANTKIAVDDEEFKNTQLRFLIVFSDGSKLCGSAKADESELVIKTKPGSGEDDTFATQYKTGDIVAEIADPGIAEIKEGVLKAVKVGTTQILLKVKGEEKPFYVMPLTVDSRAVPNTITITAVDKVLLNTSTGTAFTDEVSFEVEVKDQHGRAYPGADIDVEKVGGTGDADLLSVLPDTKTDSDGVAEVVFCNANGTDVKVGGEGSVVLNFTAEARGKKVSNRTKSIKCSMAGEVFNLTDAYSQRLKLASDTLDQVQPNDNTGLVYAPGETTVKVYGLDKSGYRISDDFTLDLYDETTVKATTGSHFVFKAYNGSSELKVDAGKYARQYVDNGKISSVAVKKTINKVEKLDAKSITVKLYEVIVADDHTIKDQKLRDSKAITLEDNQDELVVEKTADKVKAAKAAAKDFKDAFEITYGDDDVTALVTFDDAAVGSKSAFVKHATYVVNLDATFGVGVTYDVVGEVNYTLVIE